VSEIDGYRNHCIGIVACPSRFPLLSGWGRQGEEQAGIPMYRLDEDADTARSFEGKRGDILLGGGSGEHPAVRIAIPEAFHAFTDPEWMADSFDSWATIVRAYWTMTDAYLFGDGYVQRGWMPDTPIEYWLARHILRFLADTYPADYRHLLGPELFAEDGAICRQPTEGERTHWGTSSG